MQTIKPEVNHVYESKRGALVLVVEITQYGSARYRKCDAKGLYLDGTRTTETRDTDFARRFPVDHGHL